MSIAENLRQLADREFGAAAFNPKLSTEKTARYGHHGSVAVELEGDKAGTWFDHEHGTGGHLGADRHRKPRPNTASVIYSYKDAAGNEIARVKRTDLANGEKKFSQCRPDGNGGWEWKGPTLPWPLYRLDVLAVNPDAMVLICEGEKACEAAQKLAGRNFVAVSWMGGCKNVAKADWAPLAGRDCIVWPDADPAGADAARDVVEQLRRIASSVRVLRVHDLPLKADAADVTWNADEILARMEVVEPEAKPGRPKEKLEGQPLDHVEAFLRRFVAYPSEHACVAHVLWIAHTHLMELWDSTPRIAFLSPEVGSGKSRALEVSELLVPNPVESINVSPAYIFRKIGSDDGRPTLLYDEIDTVFGPKAKENEETRGLLNAGHRRHGYAGRCVVRGKEIFTEEIPAYCAVALAGLGDLPETILSRCVIVRMRRRAPSEQVEAFRRRVEAPRGHAIRAWLSVWADRVSKFVTKQWPEMPPGVSDRHADVWEALLAVADAAGGDWPHRARLAAVELVAESKRSTPSLGIRLLGDLKVVFGDRDAMSTKDILAALCAIEEAPWDDIKGKPINDRGLAFRLKQYQIHSKKIRFTAGTLQGYDRADFHDPWLRYLSEPPIASGTSRTPEQTNAECSGVPDVPDAMGETDRAEAL